MKKKELLETIKSDVSGNTPMLLCVQQLLMELKELLTGQPITEQMDTLFRRLGDVQETITQFAPRHLHVITLLNDIERRITDLYNFIDKFVKSADSHTKRMESRVNLVFDCLDKFVKCVEAERAPTADIEKRLDKLTSAVERSFAVGKIDFDDALKRLANHPVPPKKKKR